MYRKWVREWVDYKSHLISKAVSVPDEEETPFETWRWQISSHVGTISAISIIKSNLQWSQRKVAKTHTVPLVATRGSLQMRVNIHIKKTRLQPATKYSLKVQ